MIILNIFLLFVIFLIIVTIHSLLRISSLSDRKAEKILENRISGGKSIENWYFAENNWYR